MSTACEHVEEVRHDWEPAQNPICEECAKEGRTEWVSLRRCLTCGHVGCCDSSPGLHATGHHRATEHPMVETLQPGQDWLWCYVDEITLRPVEGDWQQVDLFYEIGVAYMGDHLAAGGDTGVAEDFTMEQGFPLGRWAAEMRRRHAAGELGDEQVAAIEALDGWRWEA
jgi:hypothetical protein